jgi:hypothetical protein
MHGHVNLSLVERRLEPPHILGRNRLHRPVRHGLLTGLHLSRVFVLLLATNLFSRHAEDKTICRATLIMSHVSKVRLRSNCNFLVMLVRLMSLHWQRLHASIDMLRRHHWQLSRFLLLALVHAGGLTRRSTVKVWHFCFDFLLTILRRHGYGHGWGLFCSVVVVVKVVIAVVRILFVRRSYGHSIRSGKVLRRGLNTRSRLLRGGAEDSGRLLVGNSRSGLRRTNSRRRDSFGLPRHDLILSDST